MTATIAPRYTDRVLDLDELDEVIMRNYLRVSKDESGRARSNSEQQDDLAAVADRKRRWSLHSESYEDVGSASKFKRKARPDFGNLIADLRAGTFGAHVLGLWEPSRGSREVPEWYMLLGLLAEAGIFVYVHSLGRVFNPHLSADWGDLMRAAVKAEEEVRQSSERINRATKTDAGRGSRNGGRRAFGYENVGNGIVEEEAAIIRELVRRVLAGDSVRSLAADLNRRGIKTTAGNDWHPGVVRQMLTSARIAGLRSHKGIVVAEGQWEGIIDEVTRRRLLAALAAKPRNGTRGRTPWLLTGFLRCAVCGEGMVGNIDSAGSKGGKPGTRRYACRRGVGYSQTACGSNTIKAEPLEELLGDLVTAKLRDVAARRNASTGIDDDDDLAELARIEADRNDLAELALSPKSKAAEYAALDRREKAAEARIAAKVARVAPLDFVAAEGFLGRPWADLDVEERRTILRAVLDFVEVSRSTNRGSNRFEASRIPAPDEIAWKPTT